MAEITSPIFHPRLRMRFFLPFLSFVFAFPIACLLLHPLLDNNCNRLLIRLSCQSVFILQSISYVAYIFRESGRKTKLSPFDRSLRPRPVSSDARLLAKDRLFVPCRVERRWRSSFCLSVSRRFSAATWSMKWTARSNSIAPPTHQDLQLKFVGLSITSR